MADQNLVTLAREVGDDWKYGEYYDRAEQSIELQWRILIWPHIKDCDFSTVVEVAAGHGRNTRMLLKHALKLYAVDIQNENIEFMKQRFEGNERISYIVNNGIDLADIADGEATFVYSFDSMVHFDSDIVRAYLREFQRILAPGGYGFCHYSNNTRNPTGTYRDHPGWRNFMSRELFEHYAHKEGLEPIRSNLIDWLRDSSYSDATTLFRKKPAPVVVAPLGETPLDEPPVAVASVDETLVVDTPVVDAPLVETLVAQTPVVETPVAEAPAGDASGAETSTPTADAAEPDH